MARISNRLLAQWVDDAGVVILDEVTGDEVMVAPTELPGLIEALRYFLEGTSHASTFPR